MTLHQKRPITDELAKGTPEHIITDPGLPHSTAPNSLQAFLQSESDDPGSQNEPLHIVPIITEDGEFHGYFLPVVQHNTPADPAETVESTVSDMPNAATMPTVILTPPGSAVTRQTGREAATATGISVVLLCLIALLTLSTTLYAAFANVIITITPQEQHLSATVSLNLITGVPTSVSQVEARRLSPITLSQTLSTEATGSYHQQPTYALGYLTFYNGSFSSVTIPAGTQLTGQSGMSIITTRTASIPGIDQSITPPALGQATIAAQAAQIGSHGNIAAYDVQGVCSACGASILVKNTQAFSGGQDEKTFTIVKQSDIDSMKAPLTASLAASMNDALNGQARPGESFLRNSCNPTYKADHREGDQALQVKLRASETCSALAYFPAIVQHNATALLQAQVPNAHYQLVKSPLVRVVATALFPIPTITVSISGMFIYLFTQSQRSSLLKTLAGMKPNKAYQWLQTYPGIEKVTISGVPFTGTLPMDTSRITIRFS